VEEVDRAEARGSRDGETVVVSSFVCQSWCEVAVSPCALGQRLVRWVSVEELSGGGREVESRRWRLVRWVA
jgi:hypothetical protein